MGCSLLRKDQLEGGISKHHTVQTASNHAPKDTPAVQILNFSARNTALFGCLNCISFLMHLSNAIVALKQKTNKQTNKDRDREAYARVRRNQQEREAGRKLQPSAGFAARSVCVAAIRTR